MRVLSVVGARPQFVKLAPISRAMTAFGVEHLIVHTGQHYDAAMSDVFFSELEIPKPDLHLGVGSGSHGEQTGAILAALEQPLLDMKPDTVLVYGDTNSTLAGAITAVKLHVPLAHLEAGLRSRNRLMAEEHNRVLTDHAADICLAPTETAMSNLEREGLADRAVFVGDVMADLCLQARRISKANAHAATLPLPPGPFILATIHRAENTDNPERLTELLEGLARIDIAVLLAAHPRLVARSQRFGLTLQRGSIHTIPPLSYMQMIAALDRCTGVVTDSGGLQKEAYVLARVCTTLRPDTEWPETLDGWNTLDPTGKNLSELAARPAPRQPPRPAFGDGRAAWHTVQTLTQWQ